MTALGAATAVAGALVVQVLLASPASAHDELLSTDPAAGSTVATAPETVVLTFAEPPLSLGMGVDVSGPSGSVSLGAPMLAGSTVRQMLQAGAPAGTYTVRWRVTADDGHPVTGSFTFVASAPGAVASPVVVSASPDATPAANSTKSTGNDHDMLSPLLWWGIVGAAVVLVVAAATLAVSRRRGAGGQDSG